MSIANNNVCLATAEQSQQRQYGGGRSGTITDMTLEQFGARFGNPHDIGDGDKVTAQWFFMTPRGMVSVYDYWWNADNILSIGNRNATKTNPFGNRNAVRWLIRYLREKGISATTKHHA